MVLKNNINGLGPELFLDLFFKRCLSWVLSKSDPYDFIFQTWVMSSAVQKADKSSWWSSFRLGPSGFYFCVRTLWIHFWFYPPENPENIESSPCYQTWHATNTGKTNSIGRENWERHMLPWNLLVLFLEHFWMLTWNLINFISGTSWFYFANPSVGWLMIFSLRNMWGWTPQISFLQFWFSSLGTYDLILFFRGPTPPGCTTRRSFHSTLRTPTLHTLLYTPHSTLYTLHSSLHTLHSSLYTPHSTLYTPRSTLSTPDSTLYTLRSTLHTPHFTLHTPHFTLHTLHFTLGCHVVLRGRRGTLWHSKLVW